MHLQEAKSRLIRQGLVESTDQAELAVSVLGLKPPNLSASRVRPLFKKTNAVHRPERAELMTWKEWAAKEHRMGPQDQVDGMVFNVLEIGGYDPGREDWNNELFDRLRFLSDSTQGHAFWSLKAKNRRKVLRRLRQDTMPENYFKRANDVAIQKIQAYTSIRNRWGLPCALSATMLHGMKPDTLHGMMERAIPWLHESSIEPDEKRLPRSWNRFGARFHVDPFNSRAWKRQASLTMVLRPDQKDEKTIERTSYGFRRVTTDLHVPDALAYARFFVDKLRLVVFELQTDMTEASLPDKYRRKYQDWHKILLWKLRDYAREKGLNQVLLTSGHYQKKRWPTLHPSVATKVYGRAAQDAGFRLIQLEKPMKIEGVSSDLFWAAEPLTE